MASDVMIPGNVQLDATVDPGYRTRYPGAGPFTELQQDIYFGRESEIEGLSSLVARQQQVVLYAKSGMGKSSLLQAGVIPKLREMQWNCVSVRFYPHRPSCTSPQQRLLQAAPEVDVPVWLRKLDPNGDHKLWINYKAAQVRNSGKFLLVFDQFEELFTYPESDICEFKMQLAQLLYQTVPEGIRKQLRGLQEKGGAIDDDRFDELFEPMSIKIIVALREDRLSLIHGLMDSLPDLRHNWFEIRSLGLSQARRAIEKPAALKGEFSSRPFKYTEEAMQRILSHLSSDNSRSIETTQLQVVCQKILTIRMQIEQEGRDEIGLMDLPDFNDILRNFYLEILNEFSGSTRQEIHIFIEERLIHEGNRIPVAESICEELVGRNVLQYLVQRHLLRAERNSTGGNSYELCHDILVAPILAIRERRRVNEELEISANAERKLQEELAKSKARQLRDQYRLRMARIRTLLIAALLFLTIALGSMVLISKQRLILSRQKEVENLNDVKIANDSLEKVLEQYHNADSERRKINCKMLVFQARNFINAKQFSLAKSSVDSARSNCGETDEIACLMEDLRHEK